MVKEATLQVRMESDLKADAEKLYRRLGTSFAEAVRIFARQSLTVGGMPFAIQLELPKPGVPSMRGVAHKYAGKRGGASGEELWAKAAVEKYARTRRANSH